jgi:hypothetical protein
VEDVVNYTLENIVSGSQRWLRYELPFPYVVASNVFQDVVYKAMEEEFYGWLARGLSDEPLGFDTRFSRALGSYDAYSFNFSDEQAGAFDVLLSPRWCQLLAALFDVDATHHVNIGLHHHGPGSVSGWPHTDLAPGWFADDEPRPDRYTLFDHTRVDYQSGQVLAGNQSAVEEVRAVAVLIYLANEPWQPGDGGETALFTGPGAGSAQPAAMVPPINNSMLVFECTPFSYHTFLSNTRTTRNSVVMWLHRPKADVIERWTERPIVSWGTGGT